MEDICETRACLLCIPYVFATQCKNTRPSSPLVEYDTLTSFFPRVKMLTGLTGKLSIPGLFSTLEITQPGHICTKATWRISGIHPLACPTPGKFSFTEGTLRENLCGSILLLVTWANPLLSKGAAAAFALYSVRYQFEERTKVACSNTGATSLWVWKVHASPTLAPNCTLTTLGHECFPSLWHEPH